MWDLKFKKKKISENFKQNDLIENFRGPWIGETFLIRQLLAWKAETTMQRLRGLRSKKTSGVAKPKD